MGWLRWCGFCALVSLPACGPSTSAGDGSATGGESSSGDAGATTGAGEGPECPPADAALALDMSIPDAYGGNAQACTVASVAATEVVFDCDGGDGGSESGGGGQVVVGVDASPPLPLALEVGAEVDLVTLGEYQTEGDMVTSSVVVRARDSLRLELALVDSHETAWIAELGSLQLAPQDGACTRGPDASACLTGERRMWQATVDGATGLVGDGLRTEVGGYVLHVQRAYDGQLLECLDVESSFYQLAIARSG